MGYIYNKYNLASLFAVASKDSRAIGYVLFNPKGEVVGCDGFMLIKTSAARDLSKEKEEDHEFFALQDIIAINKGLLVQPELLSNLKLGTHPSSDLDNTFWIVDKKDSYVLTTHNDKFIDMKEPLPSEMGAGKYPDVEKVIPTQEDIDKNFRVSVDIDKLEKMVKALKKFSSKNIRPKVALSISEAKNIVVFSAENSAGQKFLGGLMPMLDETAEQRKVMAQKKSAK